MKRLATQRFQCASDLPRAVDVQVGLALARERRGLGVLAGRRGADGDVEVLPLVLAAEDAVRVLDRLLDRGRHGRRDDERARQRGPRVHFELVLGRRVREADRAARPRGSGPRAPRNRSPRTASSSRTSIQVPGATGASTNSWNARAVVANPFGIRTPLAVSSRYISPSEAALPPTISGIRRSISSNRRMRRSDLSTAV